MSIPTASTRAPFALTLGAAGFATAAAAADSPLKEPLTLFIRALERDLAERFTQLEVDHVGLQDFCVNEPFAIFYGSFKAAFLGSFVALLVDNWEAIKEQIESVIPF